MTAGGVTVSSGESWLGSWTLARSAPHPELRPHVTGYTGYLESASRPFRRREVPTAGVTLIISFGQPLLVTAPGGPSRVVESFVAGLWDRAVMTEHAGHQRGIQVDLTPLGAFSTFGVPMHELANGIVDLDDLGDPDAGTMGARLADEATWRQRFDLLDRMLLDRVRRGPVPAPAAVEAWRLLARSAGDVAIAELAADVGWSRKQLAERFREQVGLPPKVVARLLRFRRAVALIEAGRPLAEVAATCGYYDQAHLNRDFRSLAGYTPGQYLRSQETLRGGSGESEA